MMYDVLRDYRAYLEKSLSKETARTYTNRLKVLLEGQNLIHTIEKLDISKIMDVLSKIKYKNHFSQSKNALLYFLKWQGISPDKTSQRKMKELEQATHKKYRKLKSRNLKEIDSHIKHLKNLKSKVSYQTLLQTGLRIAELSQITPKDINLTHNQMTFTFIGKGRKKETVTFFREENPLLFQRLEKMIQSTPNNKKLFCSAIYLQNKAHTYHFECLDLRRAYAKLIYKKTRSKEEVRKKLRHSKIKTTNIYLRSKIKI